MVEELENRIQRFALVDALAEFAANVTYEDLPAEAVEAAKIFIMDTLAVGVAGVTYEATGNALSAARLWGEGSTRVVGRPGVRLPRTSAAFVNGMQVHALEWDGLHELSVVIALCAPIGAMAAEFEQQRISGKALIVAVVVAVEVAVFFGGDTSASPRFFRPSAAGGMGAAAGMARLRGFDKQQVIHTLGLAHAQTAGTMQAHWEGSMALPMQIGNASRMAHLCADMVGAGMTGPIDFIDGRFGYFKLFEAGGQIERLLTELGSPYKILQMAHKPYPAGRATQAALTMIRQLRAEATFETSEITGIDIHVPPLIMLLVGRPATQDMTPSYARLCLRFIVPLMLLDDDIDPRRFGSAAFSDPKIERIGQLLQIHDDGNVDRNALGPQHMQIHLADGRSLSASCDAPLGAPDNPLSRQQREDKVRRCFELGLTSENAERFIDASNNLADLEDVGILLDMVC
ncbi:MAG: MmgE/PrpD family protein [Pseudomonadota bacterium]